MVLNIREITSGASDLFKVTPLNRQYITFVIVGDKEVSVNLASLWDSAVHVLLSLPNPIKLFQNSEVLYNKLYGGTGKASFEKISDTDLPYVFSNECRSMSVAPQVQESLNFSCGQQCSTNNSEEYNKWSHRKTSSKLS